MVAERLGADKKPVYAALAGSPTTTGKANFDQWFRDTPGVNKSKVLTLPFTVGPTGRTVFDSANFFPIDNDPATWGNTPGQAHNFHFSYELHTQFFYSGGEVFTFRGDDDVWAFVNGLRIVDLGGVHGAQDATVNIDAEAARLGITKGTAYAFDFFFVERHTTESNFRLETSLKFVNCDPILPQ
jgi:fibro-slime domain-containing protein